MALVKTTLETAIEKALNASADKEVDPAEARKQIAKDLATAIDAYIKSATVVSSGLGNSGTPVISTSTAIS